jgi:anti-anti-sigma factor
MRADQQPAPLEVVRSEAAPGRVGLRLIGELDLNTVPLLEAELARTREPSPPSVIDLSELRFLDLTGLRALLRAVDDVAGGTRLVGATGIVKRLVSLAHTLDLEAAAPAARTSFSPEPTTRISRTESPDGNRSASATRSGSELGISACGNDDRKPK